MSLELIKLNKHNWLVKCPYTGWSKKFRTRFFAKLFIIWVNKSNIYDKGK